MMYLRRLVIFFLFLLGGARRSVRIDDTYHDVSAEAREAFIPQGFGMGAFRRTAPRAGAWPQGLKQDDWQVGVREAWFPCGPRRFANVAMASVVSVPVASAPCPRRQLLMYVAHVGGNNATPVTVYARTAGSEWRSVGRIAVGTAERADMSRPALLAAAQLQRRLILKHACRLYKELRPAERSNVLELGVGLGDDVELVPAPVRALDATQEQMVRCGFAGDAGDGKGIYADFARAGPVAYDRAAVRAEIRRLLASSRDGSGPQLSIFAWKNCGFATKARGVLESRGISFADVVIGKFSPLHAELVLLTGQATVPYIYERGAFLGGYEPSLELPGLVGALDRLAAR